MITVEIRADNFPDLWNLFDMLFLGTSIQLDLKPRELGKLDVSYIISDTEPGKEELNDVAVVLERIYRAYPEIRIKPLERFPFDSLVYACRQVLKIENN